jgi:hypothetical protein
MSGISSPFGSALGVPVTTSAPLAPQVSEFVLPTADAPDVAAAAVPAQTSALGAIPAAIQIAPAAPVVLPALNPGTGAYGTRFQSVMSDPRYAGVVAELESLFGSYNAA